MWSFDKTGYARTAIDSGACTAFVWALNELSVSPIDPSHGGFTRAVRRHVGVSRKACYRKTPKTETAHLDGGNIGNIGAIPTEHKAAHGPLLLFSFRLRLPGVAVLRRKDEGK